MAPATLSVVIAAGGTGGHIYPGLALAEAIASLAPDTRLSFLGTPRGLEKALIPGAGRTLHLVDMVPFTGAGRALLPFALGRASVQARTVLRAEGADVAVGMGGYASIPLIAGARLAGVPSLIHESGAIPGRANLLAARLTRRVALSFAAAGSHFPVRCELRTVGMPLGPGLARFDRQALRPSARSALGVAAGTKLVLVNGGSQGAQSLNRLALGLGRRWRGRDDVAILLKAGTAHHDAVAAELAADQAGDGAGGGGASVVTLTRFIERMDHAYAAADMAVCRAGAGTVAELAVVGLPAVLVPYPHATADHQSHNAAALVEAGGALLVADGEATPDRVGPLLEARLDHPDALERMRAGLEVAAHPRAAEELAAWALELAGAGR